MLRRVWNLGVDGQTQILASLLWMPGWFLSHAGHQCIHLWNGDTEYYRTGHWWKTNWYMLTASQLCPSHMQRKVPCKHSHIISYGLCIPFHYMKKAVLYRLMHVYRYIQHIAVFLYIYLFYWFWLTIVWKKPVPSASVLITHGLSRRMYGTETGHDHGSLEGFWMARKWGSARAPPFQSPIRRPDKDW